MDPAYSSDTVRLFPIYRLKKVRVCWEVKRPQEAGLQLPPEIRTARDSRPVGRGASAPPSPAGGGSPGHWHVGPHGAWPLQKLRGAWLSSLRPRPLSGRGDGLGEGLVSLPGLVLLFSAASPNPSSSSRERSGGTPVRSGPPPKGHPNHVALDGKTGSWEKPSGGPWGSSTHWVTCTAPRPASGLLSCCPLSCRLTMKSGPSPFPPVWGVYLTLSSFARGEVCLDYCLLLAAQASHHSTCMQSPAQPWGPP